MRLHRHWFLFPISLLLLFLVSLSALCTHTDQLISSLLLLSRTAKLTRSPAYISLRPGQRSHRLRHQHQRQRLPPQSSLSLAVSLLDPSVRLQPLPSPCRSTHLRLSCRRHCLLAPPPLLTHGSHCPLPRVLALIQNRVVALHGPHPLSHKAASSHSSPHCKDLP